MDPAATFGREEPSNSAATSVSNTPYRGSNSGRMTGTTFGSEPSNVPHRTSTNAVADEVTATLNFGDRGAVWNGSTSRE